MKKKLAVLLALAMSVTSLVACGGEETTESSTELATFTPSVEMVKVDESLGLDKLPVEEYVTLGEYKGIELKVTPVADITDEMIEADVMAYYYQHGANLLAPEDFLTEGTVAETDIALIDYEGKLDGVAFEGGTAQDAILGIGSNSFIDGFEAGLVGVKVGETVDLNLTFPGNYQSEDLAGKEVVFTVTVDGLVSLNDDTIKKFEVGMESLAEYREAVESLLLYEAENAYYSELNTAVCEALVEACPVTKIPEHIFNGQKEYAQEQIAMEAQYYYGVDGELFAQIMSGMSLSDYASAVAESATIQAVIFQAVANAEGIVISQEEIDTFVNDYVEFYGADYGYATVEDFYKDNTTEDVRLMLLQDKIVTFITDNATIGEK